jgi:hypothetical protein
MKQELAHFDAIKMALQKAAFVDEAKGIRDRAEALRITQASNPGSDESVRRIAERRKPGGRTCSIWENKGIR